MVEMADQDVVMNPFGGIFLSKDAVLYQCILKQERKVSISVIRTISLIRYHSMGALDKGVRIIEVALYM